MKIYQRHMVNFFKLVIISCTIITIGCASIEYKSDAPKKVNLDPLPENRIEVTRGWSTNIGNGVGKDNVKLLLASNKNTLVAADGQGLVKAINRADGHNIWEHNLKMSISSGPTVQNKIVILGGNAMILALDIKSGEILWKTPVTSEVLAAPKIYGDIVFVNTLDGGLTALNIKDGHQLWRFASSPPSMVLRRSSVPVVTKDYIVVGFANGKLIAINRIDGTINWSLDISTPKGRTDIQRMVDISADLVIKNDVVYAVSYQGNLTAVVLQTGQVMWEREVSSYAGLLVDDKNVYVSAANGDVLAFDRHTGGSAWVQNSLHGRNLSVPVKQRNNIVVCDEDGYVHWLDKSQGCLIGRYKFTGKAGIEASPVVYGNNLYIYGRNGHVGEITVSTH